jgi:hypothetical protein
LIKVANKLVNTFCECSDNTFTTQTAF